MRNRQASAITDPRSVMADVCRVVSRPSLAVLRSRVAILSFLSSHKHLCCAYLESNATGNQCCHHNRGFNCRWRWIRGIQNQAIKKKRQAAEGERKGEGPEEDGMG